MSANVERILQEIRGLTPEELQQVRAALDEEAAATKPKMSEEEFQEYLLKEGVISSIPERKLSSEEFRKRKPIEVKGKPVSETLIEERR
jgi:hypothetical protein